MWTSHDFSESIRVWTSHDFSESNRVWTSHDFSEITLEHADILHVTLIKIWCPQKTGLVPSVPAPRYNAFIAQFYMSFI